MANKQEWKELEQKRWICVECGDLYNHIEFSKDEDVELCNECYDKRKDKKGTK